MQYAEREQCNFVFILDVLLFSLKKIEYNIVAAVWFDINLLTYYKSLFGKRLHPTSIITCYMDAIERNNT